jgi:enoyl-CoA hydratase/carnithine racemase
LDGETSEAIEKAFVDIRDDPEVRVGIITGTGDKSFSTGGDLKYLTPRQTDPKSKTESFWKANTPLPFRDQMWYREFGILWKPMIAAVNGYCLAGGLEVALACDIIYASENASFSLRAVRVGLMDGAGGPSRLVRRVPFGMALEMMLTGDIIDAQEAYRIGLVNKVVPLPELMPTVEKLAEKLCDNPPLTMMGIKEVLYRGGLCMTLEESLRFEKLMHRVILETEDVGEGMRAFLEKRKPQFKGK